MQTKSLKILSHGLRLKKMRQSSEFDMQITHEVIFEHSLGGSLKIKMADGGIQRSTFTVKHDGSIDFSIYRKTAMQELQFFHVRILNP